MSLLSDNSPNRPGHVRVGALAAEFFMVVNGQQLEAGDDELAATTFAVARGELAAEALAIWIRQRLVALER